MPFKVWIEIEDFDEDADEGHTVGPLDVGCSGTFDTYEEAEAFARRAHFAIKDAPGWTE